MRFKKYIPKKGNSNPRFYPEDNNGECISLFGHRVGITARKENETGKQAILEFFNSLGIKITSYTNMDDFEAMLKENDLLVKGNQSYARKKKRSVNETIDNYFATKKYGNDLSEFVMAMKTQEERYHESLRIDLYKPPFSAKTLKNAVVQIDYREPEELHQYFLESKLSDNISVIALEKGDLQIYSSDEPDRVLLVERKSISDLYSGVTNENTRRLHSQAERYYQMKQEFAEQGKELQVIWIMEAQEKGNRGLYQCLPKIVNMDGLVNYLVCVLGQHVVQSYSTRHTANLILKFTQGFLERQLCKPIKIGGIRVDKTKRERLRISVKQNKTDSDSESHNVIQSGNGLTDTLALMPGIDIRVAKSLSETGKSFAQIVNMSKDDLLLVKGIGDIKAELIFQGFNQT